MSRADPKFLVISEYGGGSCSIRAARNVDAYNRYIFEARAKRAKVWVVDLLTNEMKYLPPAEVSSEITSHSVKNLPKAMSKDRFDKMISYPITNNDQLAREKGWTPSTPPPDPLFSRVHKPGGSESPMKKVRGWNHPTPEFVK
jgi:hypothetical protein